MSTVISPRISERIYLKIIINVQSSYSTRMKIVWMYYRLEGKWANESIGFSRSVIGFQQQARIISLLLVTNRCETAMWKSKSVRSSTNCMRRYLPRSRAGTFTFWRDVNTLWHNLFPFYRNALQFTEEYKNDRNINIQDN